MNAKFNQILMLVGGYFVISSVFGLMNRYSSYQNFLRTYNRKSLFDE
jgi:hypothetical protein